MQILRESDIKQRLGISSSTIRRLEAFEGFPKRTRIGKRFVGWSHEAVEQWIKDKFKGESINE